jgi:hypothetical protein
VGANCLFEIRLVFASVLVAVTTVGCCIDTLLVVLLQLKINSKKLSATKKESARVIVIIIFRLILLS